MTVTDQNAKRCHGPTSCRITSKKHQFHPIPSRTNVRLGHTNRRFVTNHEHGENYPVKLKITSRLHRRTLLAPLMSCLTSLAVDLLRSPVKIHPACICVGLRQDDRYDGIARSSATQRGNAVRPKGCGLRETEHSRRRWVTLGNAQC